MADIKSEKERSRNMAAIRSKNTKIELSLRKMLFARGYRYRLHSNSIPGHPDMWLKKYNSAIFINGCFWHRHAGCKYAYVPKSHTEFWDKKFEQNIARDLTVREQLKEKHIRCLIVWECSIKLAQKKKGTLQGLIKEVERFLHSDELYREI